MTQFVSNGREWEIRLQEGVRKSACIFETTTQKIENRIILKRIFRIIKDPFEGLSNRHHVMAESGRFELPLQVSPH